MAPRKFNDMRSKCEHERRTPDIEHRSMSWVGMCVVAAMAAAVAAWSAQNFPVISGFPATINTAPPKNGESTLWIFLREFGSGGGVWTTLDAPLYFGPRAPWRLFSWPQGIEFSSPLQVAANSSVLRLRARRGLHWQWPVDGELGSRTVVTNIQSASGQPPIELDLLSRNPPIFRVRNFLSVDEMDALKEFAVSDKNPYKMRRSTTGTESWTQNGESKTTSTRTSENAYDINSPTAKLVKRRAFELLRIPFQASMTDGLQVVRYSPGQAYLTHHDYYPANSKSGEGMFDFNSSNPTGANRFATIFFYLNNVEMGGQTVFPQARPDGETHAATTSKSGTSAEEAVAAAKAQHPEVFADGTWQANMVKSCFSDFAVTPRPVCTLLRTQPCALIPNLRY